MQDITTEKRPDQTDEGKESDRNKRGPQNEIDLFEEFIRSKGGRQNIGSREIAEWISKIYG